MIDLRLGDCIEILKTLPDNSVDSIVTDPPYGIGFMNKEWDSPQKHKELIEREAKRSQDRFEEGKSPVKGGFSKGVQPGLPIGGAKEGRWFQEWCEQWAVECFRVLKPGGHLLSFSSPRTYHRMATAFEDSGFQIRDQIMWVFGSGFPKSHNIGKAIDKIQGNESKIKGFVPRYPEGTRGEKSTGDSSWFGGNGFEEQPGMKPVYEINNDWEGWGTALKPGHEPICMARKPLTEKSIAENVLKWGTGGINIDDSRIGYSTEDKDKINFDRPRVREKNPDWVYDLGITWEDPDVKEYNTEGRFPANIMFDEEAGKLLDEQSGTSKTRADKNYKHSKTNSDSEIFNGRGTYTPREDEGGASRFFYCPKVSKKERGDGNIHPTVKPIKLMEYLITLVTPKGGVVLEPFMGSGSTGIAAKNLGFSFIGIEKEQEYFDIAQQRINSSKND